MRQLFPIDAGLLGSDDVSYAALGFPEAPTGRPYVFANMVSTVDGKTSLSGRVAGLGSRTDRQMMRLLRASADAILWGANSLRAEPVDPRVSPELAASREGRGQPPQPLAVTVSASLALDPGHRFFVNGRERSLILTTIFALASAGTDLERVATLAVVGEERVDLAAALGELRERWGVSRLLCEGGPSLNQQLLELGLLDEIFWTIAPKLAGGHGPGLLDGGDRAERIRARLDLISLLEHEGELFARYRVLHDRA
jgi:riboflavin-specific deaminase-like protein